MMNFKEIYKAPYRLDGYTVYTSDNREMIYFGYILSDYEKQSIVDAMNNDMPCSIKFDNIIRCNMSPCLIYKWDQMITIKGWLYLTRTLNISEYQAEIIYDDLTEWILSLISNKSNDS